MKSRFAVEMKPRGAKDWDVAPGATFFDRQRDAREEMTQFIADNPDKKADFRVAEYRRVER